MDQAWDTARRMGHTAWMLGQAMVLGPLAVPDDLLDAYEEGVESGRRERPGIVQDVPPDAALLNVNIRANLDAPLAQDA